MTNAELIQAIKAEIERLKGICTAQIKANPGQTLPFVMEMTGYDKLLSFLSTLEESTSKDFPTTDEEIKRFLATHPKVELPEKYKTPDWMFEKAEGSVLADLEEAAEEYAKTSFTRPYSDNPDEDVTIVEPDKYAGFIAGAEWQKEQFQELLWMLMRPIGGWGEDKDNNEVNDN